MGSFRFRSEQASSIRSMALSGRNRSVMYRSESSTAWRRIPSGIFTPWNCSYLGARPWRIFTESSMEGSFTVTGWNRRSRAVSFSMDLRYSLKVVAPITWISPRERAGFKILAAFMLPSASPAPTMLWTSSIIRMMLPRRFTSSIRPFIRLSNWPRNWVPATSAVRSRR